MVSNAPDSVPMAPAGLPLTPALPSTQLALCGLAGQPAGAVSRSVATTPLVPVRLAAPLPDVAPTTVTLSVGAERPLNAKPNRLLPDPLATVLTICTVGLLATTAIAAVLASHASPAAEVQDGSPPPLRLTVLVPPPAPTAVPATLIGMRIEKVPGATPLATLQPVRLLPLVGQPLRTPVVVPATKVGVPLSVMPFGNVSAAVMAAVVVKAPTVTFTE